MASQPELLQTCLQNAAQAGRIALEQCIDDAVAGLQIAETQSEKMVDRDRMATAWRELQKNKPVWAAQYPGALQASFNEGFSDTVRAALLAAGTYMQPQPALGAAVAAFSPSKAAAFEGLSLVDDRDVSQAIESSRLLQQLLPVVELPLAELDKLIGAMQGLPNVRPELNPLRPESFASSLRALIVAVPAEPDVHSLWLKYLAAPLARELKRLYERLVNQLEMARVQGVSYRVLQTPSTGGRGGSGGGAQAAPGNGPSSVRGPFGYVSDEPVAPRPLPDADFSSDTINDEVFRDFLLQESANDNRGLAPAYYDNIEEELRALKGMGEPALDAPQERGGGFDGQVESDDIRDAVPAGQLNALPMDGGRPVDVGSQLSEKVWGTFGRRKARALVRTELKKKARRVGQVMGLEVVHQLVDQVAQDPRLLAPVREGIVALEPSLLRLAMVDPRFFRDDAHPGRRLMERVAQRSFKYNQERSPEFGAFFEPVKSAFNALNRLTIADALPFSEALVALENHWDEQDAAETSQRNAVLQALRFAEERQAVADQIAFDLSKRADLDDLPGLVLDFLFGPWSLAMAQARLTDTRNQIDPQGLGLVVSDLVWSAKRQMTMRQPAKLIEMIPGLLTRLHGGLELLGTEPSESAVFFEGLMRIHQPVLKLRRLKSQRDAEESMNAPLEPDELPATPEQRSAKAAAQPWMGREDREAAGFDDLLPTDLGDLHSPGKDPIGSASGALPEDLTLPLPVASDAAAMEAGRLPFGESTFAGPVSDFAADSAAAAIHPGSDLASDAESAMLALRSGVWVDLFYRHRWLRAQLVWASSRGTLFMFISHGGRAHSMTRRTCERLLRERLLRPVDSQGVVAQALDAVVSGAAARPVAP